MKRRLTQLLTWVIPILLISIVSPLESHAATPTIYESMTGTDGATMNAVAGSSDSAGSTTRGQEIVVSVLGRISNR